MKQIYLFLFVLITINAKAQIVITEIMYNAPESGSDLTEYIELYNNGSSTVDLTGYSFSQGVTHTFTSGTINPNEYFIITVNETELNNRYGIGTADAEWTSGGLNNGGEDIILLDASSNMVDIVDYDDASPWPTEPDGTGSSLRLCDPNSDNNLASNWTASDESTGITINSFEVKGTPGQAPDCSTLNINEFIVTNKIKLYPNPISDFIQISGLLQKENYSIYTITGSRILNGNISNQENIDIRNFTKGFYFLKFDNGNTIKFLKE